MTQPTANDVKVFVPAKHFERSLSFYTSLGWRLNWRHGDDLAEIELAGARLYLQNFYDKAWAENFMIYVPVDDAHAWHAHVESVIDGGGFPDARVNAPREEAYGALVTYAWDPSGVLLHFAQSLSTS